MALWWQTLLHMQMGATKAFRAAYVLLHMCMMLHDAGPNAVVS
jgi:hypothetical protein